MQEKEQRLSFEERPDEIGENKKKQTVKSDFRNRKRNMAVSKCKQKGKEPVDAVRIPVCKGAASSGGSLCKESQKEKTAAQYKLCADLFILTGFMLHSVFSCDFPLSVSITYYTA